MPAPAQNTAAWILCELAHQEDLARVVRDALLYMFLNTPCDTLLHVVGVLQDSALVTPRVGASLDALPDVTRNTDAYASPMPARRAVVAAFSTITALDYLLRSLDTCDAATRAVFPLQRVYSTDTEPHVCGIGFVNTGILRMFDRLLAPARSDSANTNVLDGDVDPANPARFAAMFSFHFWCAATESLLDLLGRHHLNSV